MGRLATQLTFQLRQARKVVCTLVLSSPSPPFTRRYNNNTKCLVHLHGGPARQRAAPGAAGPQRVWKAVAALLQAAAAGMTALMRLALLPLRDDLTRGDQADTMTSASAASGASDTATGMDESATGIIGTAMRTEITVTGTAGTGASARNTARATGRGTGTATTRTGAGETVATETNGTILAEATETVSVSVSGTATGRIAGMTGTGTSATALDLLETFGTLATEEHPSNRLDALPLP